MHSLHVKDIPSFLKRFGNFIDGELRNINIISPSQIEITIAGQDENRRFDWISMKFLFSEISAAQLLENSTLLHVNMSEGLNIMFTNNQYNFTIQNSTFSITSTSIKYEEGQF